MIILKNIALWILLISAFAILAKISDIPPSWQFINGGFVSVYIIIKTRLELDD